MEVMKVGAAAVKYTDDIVKKKKEIEDKKKEDEEKRDKGKEEKKDQAPLSGFTGLPKGSQKSIQQYVVSTKGIDHEENLNRLFTESKEADLNNKKIATRVPSKRRTKTQNYKVGKGNKNGKVESNLIREDESNRCSACSGVFFDEHDNIYVSDSESDNVANPGWEMGIRIGDAHIGWVHYFIRVPTGDPRNKKGTGAEFVAVDKYGNIYGGEPFSRKLQKYDRV